MAPRPSPQTERVVNLFEQLAGDGSRGMTLAEVSRQIATGIEHGKRKGGSG